MFFIRSRFVFRSCLPLFVLALWFVQGWGVSMMASETHSNPTVILISAPKVAGSIIGNDLIREANVSDEDELDVVINATCRVSVGDSGGSGTIVGHSSDGRSLILTNAHVVGTQKGRFTKVER